MTIFKCDYSNLRRKKANDVTVETYGVFILTDYFDIDNCLILLMTWYSNYSIQYYWRDWYQLLLLWYSDDDILRYWWLLTLVLYCLTSVTGIRTVAKPTLLQWWPANPVLLLMTWWWRILSYYSDYWRIAIIRRLVIVWPIQYDIRRDDYCVRIDCGHSTYHWPLFGPIV